MKKEKTENSIPAEKEELTGKGKAIKIVKIIINTIINILIVLVLIVSILVAVMSISSKSNNGISTIFGLTVQSIESDSMKGGSDQYEGGDFASGDLIIGKSTGFDEKAEFEVGDIVTYKGEINGNAALIVHRIVDVKVNDAGDKVYQTQGDNKETNFAPDQDDVGNYLMAYDIGSVFYSDAYHGTVLKGMGGAIKWIQTQEGFFLIILLPMIAFFLYALFRVVWSAASYKKEKELESKEDAEREKQKEIDAAVKAALAEKDGEEAKPAEAPADMTPEQMEQFKQFLAFQKAQQSAETPESFDEEQTED